MKHIRFTKEGYDALKNEHNRLVAERPAAVIDLKKARDMGDLSENGYYKAARSKLSFIDNRLRNIRYILKNAIIIESVSPNSAAIGSTVTLKSKRGEVMYRIVGDLEATPSQGKISLLSPLGRAITGKHIGDTVKVETPSGQINYTITSLT